MIDKRWKLGILIGMLGLSSYVQAESPVANLTPRKAVMYALEDNFDICILRLDKERFVFEMPKELSKYDATLSWGFDVIGDRQEKSLFGNNLVSSAVFAEDIYSQDASITQTTPWGSTWSLSYLLEHNNYGNDAFSHYNTSLAFSIEQSLWNNAFGFKSRRYDDVREKSVQSFDLRTQYQMTLVAQNVLNAFWGVYCDQKIVQNRQQILTIAEEFLQLNQRKGKYGAVESSDILAAQANVKFKKIELLASQNNFERSLLNLQDMLNQGDLHGRSFQESALVLGEFQLEKSLEEALQKRLDLRAMQEDLAAAGIQVEIRRNDKRASINLTVSYNPVNRDASFDNAFKDSLNGDHSEAFVGIRITYPWGNCSAKANYEQQKVNEQRVRTAVAQLRQTIRRDVMHTYRDLQTTHQRYLAFRELVDVQCQKLEEETQKYQTGRSTAQVTIDYQDDLLQAQNLLVQEQAHLHRSWVALHVAKNTLFEYWDL